MSLNTDESSLTAPEDRNTQNKWKPQQGVPPLSETELDEAMKSLNVTSFVEKFPVVDRTYQDPAIPLQTIGLVSFIPAKGAKPNEKGVFGFAKLRGNYGTLLEAEQRAEYLIRNVDSHHKIYHTYVGRPFPITVSSNYSAEQSEIDIRRETTQAISNNIKEHKDKEHKTMQEIKEREEKLLNESKKAREDNCIQEPEIDPYENYITLCVKKAQLSWTFLEHLKKLKEVRDIIIKTRNEIVEMDVKYPEYREQYFKRYSDAREEAGLDTTNIQDTFMKFMVEDAVIPTIDTDDVLPSV